jgi:CheY-like chemotaxis protein
MDVFTELNRTLKSQTYYHKPHVLVVEDDVTMEPIWSRVILQTAPYASIDWVTSEPEAERLIQEKALNHQLYDLVIADIFLPGPLTGIDLLERFEDIAGDRLILTSSLPYERLMQYVGPNRRPLYARKPLSPVLCQQLVQAILNPAAGEAI